MSDNINPGPVAGTIAGLDGHLRTCNLCGINSDGVVLRRFRNLPSNAEALTEAIVCFPRPVILIIEESTLAHWFLTLFRPLVDRVVVVDPKRNRLISEANTKSDPLDAYRLADLFRLGGVREVYHSLDPNRVAFRRAVQQYEDVTRESTKLKNRIRKTFHLYGMNPDAKDAFHPHRRQSLMDDLPEDGRFRLQAWYRVLDEMAACRKEALQRVRSLSRSFEEVAWFQTIPGTGILTASQLSAYLQTPDRFQRKSQVWGYARLAVVDRSSDGRPIGRQHLSRQGLGVLKAASRRIFDSSFKRNGGNNAIAQYYCRLLARINNPVHARLTTQRRILELAWTMWKRKEVFDPDRFLKNLQRV